MNDLPDITNTYKRSNVISKGLQRFQRSKSSLNLNQGMNSSSDSFSSLDPKSKNIDSTKFEDLKTMSRSPTLHVTLSSNKTMNFNYKTQVPDKEIVDQFFEELLSSRVFPNESISHLKQMSLERKWELVLNENETNKNFDLKKLSKQAYKQLSTPNQSKTSLNSGSSEIESKIGLVNKLKFKDSSPDWYVSRIRGDKFSFKDFKRLEKKLAENPTLKTGSSWLETFAKAKGETALAVALNNLNKKSIKSNSEFDIEYLIVKCFKHIITSTESEDLIHVIKALVLSLISPKLMTKTLVTEVFVIILMGKGRNLSYTLEGLSHLQDCTGDFSLYQPWMSTFEKVIDKARASKNDFVYHNYIIITLGMINIIIESFSSLSERISTRRNLANANIPSILEKSKKFKNRRLEDEIEKYESFAEEDYNEYMENRKRAEVKELPKIPDNSQTDPMRNIMQKILTLNNREHSKNILVLVDSVIQHISDSQTIGKPDSTLNFSIQKLLDKLSTEDVTNQAFAETRQLEKQLKRALDDKERLEKQIGVDSIQLIEELKSSNLRKDDIIYSLERQISILQSNLKQLEKSKSGGVYAELKDDMYSTRNRPPTPPGLYSCQIPKESSLTDFENATQNHAEFNKVGNDLKSPIPKLVSKMPHLDASLMTTTSSKDALQSLTNSTFDKSLPQPPLPTIINANDIPPPPPLPTFINLDNVPPPPPPLPTFMTFKDIPPPPPPLPHFMSSTNAMPSSNSNDSQPAPPPPPPLPKFMTSIDTSTSPLSVCATSQNAPPPPPLPNFMTVRDTPPPPPPLPPFINSKETSPTPPPPFPNFMDIKEPTPSTYPESISNADTNNASQSPSISSPSDSPSQEVNKTSMVAPPIKPKFKLKQMHWDKINDIEKTFWNDLEHRKLSNKLIEHGVLNEVEKVFIAKVSTMKKKKEVDPEVKPQKISFLSRDMAQQFGINLHMFGSLSEDRFISKVLSCHPEILENSSVLEFFNIDFEISDNLSRNLDPYSRDCRNNIAPKKDPNDLDRADRIFLELCYNLRHYWKARSRALLFIQTFQKDYADLEHKLSLVDRANACLKNSNSLKNVLGIIRSVGNFMNEDSKQALGFKLDTLQRLKFMKDDSNSMNFLHYIEKIIRQSFPEYGNFVDDLSSLTAVSNISVEQLESDCTEMVKTVQNITNSIEKGKLSQDLHPQDKILPTILSPMNKAKVKSSLLQTHLKQTMADFDSLMLYFGESLGSKNSFFNKFVSFIEEFKKVHIENVQREEEQKVYEARKKSTVKDKKEPEAVSEESSAVIDMLLERLKTSNQKSSTSKDRRVKALSFYSESDSQYESVNNLKRRLTTRKPKAAPKNEQLSRAQVMLHQLRNEKAAVL